MEKASIYGLTKEELIAWFIEHDERKFRATQVWEWLYIKRVMAFSEMTNLSKDVISLLEENFIINPLRQVIIQEAKDGTVKYLLSSLIKI